jgi:hypothetical protein
MTDPVPPAGPQTFIPFPDLAAMEEELRGEAANGESVNGTGGGGTGGGRAGLSKLQHDRRPTQDPLQILPSRRGQYRKKK